MSRNTIFGIIIVLAFGILATLAMYGLGYYDEEHITVTIKDKERVNKNSDSYYLVYTDKEVFTIQDSMVKMRWNSSDVYGALEIGKTYDLTAYGWRIEYTSSYRNILEYKEV